MDSSVVEWVGSPCESDRSVGWMEEWVEQKNVWREDRWKKKYADDKEGWVERKNRAT